MTGARQVLIERDDLERLLELAASPSRGNSLPAGWTAFGPDGEGPMIGNGVDAGFDEGDARLIERIRREVLG